jgi:hypothetical protein
MPETEFDFPTIETIRPSDVAATHRQARIVPRNRPELSFSLLIPNDWQDDDPAAAGPAGVGHEWTALAVFGIKPSSKQCSPDLASWKLISVMWKRLNVEVRLDEWSALQMAAMQIEIKSIRLWYDSTGAGVIDFGGTGLGTIAPPKQAGGASTRAPAVLRTMLRIDGSNVLAVWCMADTASYALVARDFLVAGASFRLEHPSQKPAEPMRRATTADKPAFEVNCPASWAHQPQPVPLEIKGKSALNLLLVQDDLLKALVRVKAIDMGVARVVSTESLQSDVAAELAEGAVSLQQAWTPLADPIIASVPNFVEAYVAGAVLQGQPYEAHFAVVRRDPIVFCVTMLVVPMQFDAISCMRGHRAYELALRSAAPL